MRLDFAHLKRVVSIEAVLAHRGLLDGLRPRGRQLVGPCPVHGGDNPSAFVLDRDKGLWHCFTGCQGGGDVIELVRRLDGCGHRDAARFLAGIRHGPAPALPALRQASPPAPFRPFTRRLPLDHRHPLLRDKGIAPETASLFQVGAWRGKGMLSGCVAFRLLDHEGEPLGYAGRRLRADEARRRGKWVFPPRLPKSELLYGLVQARALLLHRGLVVVECPWGVLRLHQLRIPAVALLGVHLSPRQRQILGALPRIVAMMDGDEAGRRGARVIQEQLGAERIDLPPGLDPDDCSDRFLAQALLPLLLPS